MRKRFKIIPSPHDAVWDPPIYTLRNVDGNMTASVHKYRWFYVVWTHNGDKWWYKVYRTLRNAKEAADWEMWKIDANL
jgi:hypothetical protein